MSTKLIAHFDHSGKIRSMISVHDAPQDAGVGMATAAGEQAAELDAHTLGVTEFTPERLREVAHAHTISDPVVKRALIKKPQP